MGHRSGRTTMHSFTYRLNALFTFAISVLGCLCFFCAASVYYSTCAPEIDVGLNTIDKFRPAQGGKNDQALIRFDLRADLDSCWNWNTKLLFVYLTAQYQTPTNALNQVVLWDSMLHAQETALIELQAERNKY